MRRNQMTSLKRISNPNEFVRELARLLEAEGVDAFYEPAGPEIGDWPSVTWHRPADNIGDFRFVLYYTEHGGWSLTAQHTEFGLLTKLKFRTVEEARENLRLTIDPTWIETLKETKQYRKSLVGSGRKYLRDEDIIPAVLNQASKEATALRKHKAQLERKLNRLATRKSVSAQRKTAELETLLELTNNNLSAFGGNTKAIE